MQLMKYLFFFIILTTSNIFGQGDFGNKPITIPPANNSGLEITPEKTPSIFDVKPKTAAPSLWKEEEKSVFAEKEKFVNPGDKYKKKLNAPNTEGSGDYKVFRRNQYFGDFKTKSDKIRVIYRDPQAVDGDLLKLTHNDKMLLSNIFLEGSFKSIEVKLVQGFNKIDFEALNEGQFYPNTGEFAIFDNGVEIYSSEWNLATGFKANFIIVKE